MRSRISKGVRERFPLRPNPQHYVWQMRQGWRGRRADERELNLSIGSPPAAPYGVHSCHSNRTLPNILW